MASLGVNIDHIANVRQARRTVEPDPVTHALLAELATRFPRLHGLDEIDGLGDLHRHPHLPHP